VSKTYRINEFAKRIGKAPSTIRRWEREGKLVAKRHPSGHRYFDEADVRLLTGGVPERRAVVVCCPFSCRLYGLRKYKHEIKADFPDCAATQPKALCE